MNALLIAEVMIGFLFGWFISDLVSTFAAHWSPVRQYFVSVLIAIPACFGICFWLNWMAT